MKVTKHAQHSCIMARRFAKTGRGQAINSKSPYDLADMLAYHMLQTTHFYVQVKMNINYQTF